MKLAELHCNTDSLGHLPTEAEIQQFLQTLPGWQQQQQHKLVARFDFDDYYQSMAFVNALAWIAHQQNHHPDLSVHYNHVIVCWSTHDAGQLTLNDFICAAKCQALFSASR